MSESTTNLGLVKPSVADFHRLDINNANLDKIDSAVGKLEDLQTTNKDSIVAAINELKEKGGGDGGNDGWSPTIALVSDGERIVQQVIDWIGGTGTKPVIGRYVGLTGFVDDIKQAINIKGDSGKSPYQVAVAGGYLATEAEFNELLANVGNIPIALAEILGE